MGAHSPSSIPNVLHLSPGTQRNPLVAVQDLLQDVPALLRQLLRGVQLCLQRGILDRERLVLLTQVTTSS